MNGNDIPVARFFSRQNEINSGSSRAIYRDNV